eukprot:g38747.t1
MQTTEFRKTSRRENFSFVSSNLLCWFRQQLHLEIMSDDAKALGEKKVAQYKDAFALFDKQNAGKVSTKDLGTLMRAMGSNPNNGEINDLINEVDHSGSGYITFPDFLTCMRREFRPPHTEDDVIKAFKVLDKAGSGSIAINELAQSLTELGEPFSAEELAEFKKLAGGSGNVNYSEFVKKMMANNGIWFRLEKYFSCEMQVQDSRDYQCEFGYNPKAPG